MRDRSCLRLTLFWSEMVQSQASTLLLLVAAVTVIFEIQHLKQDVNKDSNKSSQNHNIDKPEIAYHQSNVQIETCNTN